MRQQVSSLALAGNAKVSPKYACVAGLKRTQKRFAELGKRLGYGLRAEGTTVILEGPDVVVRLIPQTDKQRGILEITMRVGRQPEKQA